MDLQRILNSRKSGLWALRISRLIPEKAGIFLADRLANLISAKKTLPIVQAIRANHWVMSGGKLTANELDLAVNSNLKHIARSFYLLFNKINKPHDLQKMVRFTDEIDALIASSSERKRGIIVAGLHLCYFDIVFQAAAWRGLQGIAISLPEETEYTDAVAWQNALRRNTGFEILPATFGTFRTAIRRLRDGEVVLTGIDRPIDNPKHKPLFFGRPANLTVAHIHMALEADVPIILFAAIRSNGGLIDVVSSPEIFMDRFEDRDKSILWNAERVLKAAEDILLKAPEQWGVIQTAWPEALQEMP